MKKGLAIFISAVLFSTGAAAVNLNKHTHAYADEAQNEYVGYSKTPKNFTDDTVFKSSYDTFLEAYYTNLTDNIGRNYKGSCGYVAIGMLLSYYDTYQCDKIIPKEYDCVLESATNIMINKHRSPGINADDIVNAKSLSAEEYYEIIKEKADIKNDAPSLHAKLLTIGHDLGYYGKLDSSDPGVTSAAMVTDILKTYLKEVKLEENTDYTISTSTSLISSNIRNFVKENIRAGKPVLIGINNGILSEGHFCIAYDYDEESDEIYANFGWGSEKGHQHTRVSNAYKYYFSALTIDF